MRSISQIEADLNWNLHVQANAQNAAQRDRASARVEKLKAELATAKAPAFVDTCVETAYGTTQRLSFQVRVF